MKDPNGVSEKRWNFETAAASAGYGLLKTQEDRIQNTSTVKRSVTVTWAADARQNKYLASSITTLDPGQSYQKVLKSEQEVDKWGNLTMAKTYGFGNLTTPKTTKTFTYLQGAAYEQRFIMNRQTGMGIAMDGGTPITYPVAAYDQYGS